MNWKRFTVWVTAGIACAILMILAGFGGGKVKADGTHTDHCVCGGAVHATAENGHTCVTGSDIPTWTGVSTTEEILSYVQVEYDSASARHAVYLYLKNDVTLTAEITNFWYVSDVLKRNYNLDFNLCLNGHKLTTPANKRILSSTDGYQGTVTITDCSPTAESGIYMNASTTTGTTGGLMYAGKTVVMKLYNLKLQGGISSNNGGAVLLCTESGNEWNAFYDCTFTGGESRRSGSNVASGGNLGLIGRSKLKLYSCTVKGGIANQTGTANANGGNIVCRDGSDLYMKDCTVSGGVCTVASSSKSRYGGNIWIRGDVTYDSTVTMDNTTVGSDSENQVTGGGNILISSGSSSTEANTEKGRLILNSGSVVFGGKAGNGGNIYVDQGGSLTVNEGASIYGGTATSNGGNVITGSASSMTASSGYLRMAGGEIYGGKASSGGNVRVGGVFYMTGGTIRDSITAGNVFINICQYLPTSALLNGYMEMSGGTIQDPASGTENVSVNGATKSDDISYLNGVFRMTGGTIRISSGKKGRNVSSKGATYISGGTLKNLGYHTGSGTNIIVSDDTARGARTDTDDPKLYHPVLEITGGTFISGRAEGSVSGGNVYYYTKTRSLNTVVLKNASFSGGIAYNNAGGAAKGGNFYLGNCDAVMENCQVTGGEVKVDSGNTSSCYGGNLYLDSNTVMTIKDSEIRNGKFTNVTNGNGRNICVYGSLTLEGDSVISGSTGNTGNSVSLSTGTARLSMTGGQIDLLQAVSTGSQVSLSGGTVTRILLYAGELVMTGGKIGATGLGLSQPNAKAEISGGYVAGPITVTSGSDEIVTLSGGFYASNPTSALNSIAGGTIADGLMLIPGQYHSTDPADTTVYNYEVAAGALIEVSSRVATGYIGAIGEVTGGGLYKVGSTFTLTAPEVAGYRLNGWYAGSTKVGTGYTYTAVAAGSELYEAVYEYGAEAGFSITVKNVTEYEITGTKIGELYAAGQTVTVTYTGSAGFGGWYNASDKLVSREPAYEFVLTDNVILSGKAAGSGTLVIFHNAYSQVLKSVVLSDLTALPAVPTAIGKTNGRWTVDGAVVSSVSDLTALPAADVVNVVADYDDTGDTYTVTVIGKKQGTSGLPASWTDAAAASAVYTEQIGKQITLDAPETLDSLVFAGYVSEDGTVLTASAKTGFRYPTDVTVYAVYADTATVSGPSVQIIANVRDGSTVYLEALRYIPDGYTLLEQGILFTTDSLLGGLTPEEALVYGGSHCYKYQSNGTAANDVTGLTLKNANFNVYAKGYLIYEKTDNIGISYSEEDPTPSGERLLADWGEVYQNASVEGPAYVDLSRVTTDLEKGVPFLRLNVTKLKYISGTTPNTTAGKFLFADTDGSLGLKGNVAAGDWLLVRVIARNAPDSLSEEGKFRVALYKSDPSAAATINTASADSVVGSDWTLLEIPIHATSSNVSQMNSIIFRMTFQLQTVDVAYMDVLNYGSVSTESMAKSTVIDDVKGFVFGDRLLMRWEDYYALARQNSTSNSSLTKTDNDTAKGFPYLTATVTTVINQDNGSPNMTRSMTIAEDSDGSKGLRGRIHQNDWVLARVILRNASDSEAASGKFQIRLFGKNASGSDSTLYQTSARTFGNDWTEFLLPFQVTSATAETIWRFDIAEGYQKQKIEIAYAELLNFGGTDVSALAATNVLSNLEDLNGGWSRETAMTYEFTNGFTGTAAGDSKFPAAIKLSGSQTYTANADAQAVAAAGRMTLFAFTVKAEEVCTPLTIRVNGGNEEKWYVPVGWSKIYIALQTTTFTSVEFSYDGDLLLAEAVVSDRRNLTHQDLIDEGGMQLLEDFTTVDIDAAVNAIGTGYAKGMVSMGDYLYVIGAGVLSVVDASTPGNEQVIATLGGLGSAIRQIDACWTGEDLFITSREARAFIVNVSDPAHPYIRTHYDSLEMATGIATYKKYAFIANRQYGVEVIDISDLDHPKHMANIDTGEAQSCFVADGILCSGNWGECTVDLFDVTDAAHSVKIGVCHLSGKGDGVFIKTIGGKRYLYASVGQHSKPGVSNTDDTPLAFGNGNGLDVFDITDPASPVWLSTSRIDGRYYFPNNDNWKVDVGEAGGRIMAYVSNTYNGVYVLDVTNPKAPVRLGHITVKLPTVTPQVFAGRASIFPYDQYTRSQSPIGAVEVKNGVIYMAGALSDVHSYANSDWFETKYEKAEDIGITCSGDFYDFDVTSLGTGAKRLETNGQTYTVIRSGDKYYLAAGIEGILVLDENLNELSRIQTADLAEDIQIRDGYAYVSESLEGLGIYRVSEDGLSFTFERRYKDTNRAITQARLSVTGKFIAVQNGSNYIRILRASDLKVLISKGGNMQSYHHNIMPTLYKDRYLGFWADGSSSVQWFDFGENDAYDTPVWIQTNDPAYSFVSSGLSLTGGMTVEGNMVMTTLSGKYYLYDPTAVTTSTGLTSMTRYTITGLTGISGKPMVFGNLLVLTDRYYGNISLVDITDRTHPVLIRTFQVAGNPGLALLSDGCLYIPLSYQGLLKMPLTAAEQALTE